MRIVLITVLFVAIGATGPAEASDRHAGYYYPKPVKRKAHCIRYENYESHVDEEPVSTAIRNVLEGKSAGKVDHRFLARWRVQHNFPSTGAFGTTNRCRADDAAYTRTIEAIRFDISRSAKSYGL